MKLAYTLITASTLLLTHSAFAQCGGMQHTASAGCCAKPSGATNSASAQHNHGTDVSSQTPAKPLPAELAPIFDQYTSIQKALVIDSTQGVAEAATAMAKAMKESGSGYLGQTAASAEKLAKAKDLTTSRSEFSALSQALIQYLSVTGLAPTGYRVAYCPMAKASWLQKGNEIQNPYMGEEMRRCGRFKS